MIPARHHAALSSFWLLLALVSAFHDAQVLAQTQNISTRAIPASSASLEPSISSTFPSTPNISNSSHLELQTTSLTASSQQSSHQSTSSGSQDVLPSILTPADVSLTQVQAHLHFVQELALSVRKSAQELNQRNQTAPSTLVERNHVQNALGNVHISLEKLVQGLQLTLRELQRVEHEETVQSTILHDVLALQEAQEEEEKLEKDGMKAMDYETGHFNQNTTGLSPQKLAAVEKSADPAVFHYDMDLLAQVAILLSVAAMGGIVATYVNIPPHAGYLLGGVLVGPSCLRIVRLYKEVETISLFGSIFLLFGHGAAYSPQQSRAIRRQDVVGGVAYILSTLVLVASVAVALGWTTTWIEGLFIGLGVCFSTTAPVFHHLREQNVHSSSSSFGRTLTSILVLQDGLMSFALGTPEWFAVPSLGWIGMAMLRTIISYVAVVSLTVWLHSTLVPRLLRFLAAMEALHHAPLVLLGVVSVCLLMALVSEMLGLSLECGAFFAGLAFAHQRHASPTFESIRVMENLFGSMFFASVGMLLHPLFLLWHAAEILIMVLVIVAIKTLALTAVMTVSRIQLRHALLAALGLCQIGELALIFMIKAHAAQLVTRRTYLVFVAVIAVFLACSSVGNRHLVLARQNQAPASATSSHEVKEMDTGRASSSSVRRQHAVPGFRA